MLKEISQISKIKHNTSSRHHVHPVVVYDQTKISKTLGDMAGVANGIKSGTVGAQCWPLKYSKTVKAGKRHLVRHGDKFGMNGR